MNNNFSGENAFNQELDVELAKFNWGAFFLNFIWASFNGAWNSFWPTFLIMILFWLLTSLPLLGFIFAILNLILAIYVGKKGNEWAWYGKKWESLEQFTKVQKTWGIASPFLCIALSFIVPIVFTAIVIAVSGPFAKEVINQSKEVNKSVISKIVSAPEYKNFHSGKDIADYFINKKIYPKYFTIDENSVIVDKKGPYKAILTFEKEDGICSLEYKNCYVIYNIHTTKRLSPVEKTYFDDNGAIESDQLPSK